MSSILKALKKVENDKKIGKPDQLGIDARILQDGYSNRFSRTAVSLIAIALFVCGSGAMYFYMKHGTTDVVAPQTPSPPSASTSQPPATEVTSPESKNSSAETVSPAHLSTKPLNASSRTSNDPVKPPRSPQLEKLPDIPPIPVSRPEPIPTTTPAIAVTRPKLTVNGIAFQEGGNDNLAIINGVTVSSGTIIEGVRVEDIQKDRVRFSQGGEKFEIILNKSNR